MTETYADYQFEKLLSDASGESGIGIGCLTKKDLEVFQEVIKSQYIKVLSKYDKASANPDLAIDKYHETQIAKSGAHNEIWTLNNRHICKELVTKLTSTSCFSALSEQLDWSRILDAINLGYPGIDFRICRPKPYLDGAPLHCDSWFYHPLNKFSAPTTDLSFT